MSDDATLGLCVHGHCPLNEPHWHGGIWRSGHVRNAPTTAGEGERGEG